MMRYHRYSGTKDVRPVTGYIEPIAAGETIHWNSWNERPTARATWPITMFPHASGSDYVGGTVERSNYRVLVDDEHVMRRSVLVDGGYGTFGIAYIGAPTRKIRAICSALDAYPLLDEDDHSSMEMEIEQEQWSDWGRKDFRSALVEEFGDGLDEILDEHADADGLLDRVWWGFAEQHGDGGRVFEQGDSVHFYIDHAIKWLREERDFGAFLVLGHIEWNERATFGIARDAALEGRYDDSRTILAAWPDLVLVDLESEDTEHACAPDCARECRE